MKRRVFKKVKLTQKESNLLLKIVLEERNRLLKNGEYTDIADDFIIKNNIKRTVLYISSFFLHRYFITEVAIFCRMEVKKNVKM